MSLPTRRALYCFAVVGALSAGFVWGQTSSAPAPITLPATIPASSGPVPTASATPSASVPAPVPAAPAPQVVATAAPVPAPQPAPQVSAAAQPQAIQQNGAIKPATVHTGWIVQVGALESEDEAQKRIEAARNSARSLLAKAEPFTEPVIAKDNRKLYRARFAGLEKDSAEAVCRTLRRSDISCITVRN